MQRIALILHSGESDGTPVRFGKFCDFLGVPAKFVSVDELLQYPSRLLEENEQCFVVTTAAALSQFLDRIPAAENGLPWPIPVSGLFVADFKADESGRSVLERIFGEAAPTVEALPAQSPESNGRLATNDIFGPMSGLSVPLHHEQPIRCFKGCEPSSGIVNLIDFGEGKSAFISSRDLTFQASANVGAIDIDAPVHGRNFDVRNHLLECVPLMAFLRWAFAGVIWHAPQTPACLIVDDPLLKRRYGHFQYQAILRRMEELRFTTCIAYIPWNWRRARSEMVRFIEDYRHFFSLTVHGCDHSGAEFSGKSFDVLSAKTSLALARMNAFQQKTNLPFCRGMVFPQGVFSVEAMKALKTSDFTAAVNTEAHPFDDPSHRTVIREFWKPAIMQYASFPLYTRRNASDGLANFAFDCWLGKPCFLVAHHWDFQGGGTHLLQFIKQLNETLPSLRWTSLDQALQAGLLQKFNDRGSLEVEMFASTQRLQNPTPNPLKATVVRKEMHPELLESVILNDTPVAWSTRDGQIAFDCELPPHGEVEVQMIPKRQPSAGNTRANLQHRFKVLVRRVLSETRDEMSYLCHRPRSSQVL